MGLGASRELEAQLHTVNSASNPFLIFEDPKTLETLITIWKQVPYKYRSKLTQTRSKRVDRFSKSRSNTTITLHPSIREEFQLWKADPSTIIRHTIAIQGHCLPSHPVSSTYCLLLGLEKGIIIHRILHRFLCIKLHKLKAAFNSKSLRGNTRAEFLALVLNSGLTENQKLDVQDNIDRWTRAGKRYLAIADELDGIGSLLLLPDDISVSVWEELLPSNGTEFDKMMKCLKDRGICKEAEKIQANEVAARIEEMLRVEWTVTEYRPQESIINHNDDLMAEASVRISETTEGATSNHGDGSTETGSSTFGTNCNSINALLNPAEPTQSQQLSPVGSSSIAISSGAGLRGYEQDPTAGENAEFRSSRGEKRGLEPQAEACDPPSKQRRIDSSLFQPTNGIIYDQGRAIGNSTPANTNTSAVSQVGDVGRHTLNTPIETRKEQREIEFVYSYATKEKLGRNLEEPFRSFTMARYGLNSNDNRQDIVAMFPRDWEQDVTFSITVDRQAGHEMLQMFDLQCQPQFQSLRGPVQQYSNMPMENLPLLGVSFYQAIIRTKKYKSALGLRCACVYAFTSSTNDNDITFSIMVDRGSGIKLIHMFGMQPMEVGL